MYHIKVLASLDDRLDAEFYNPAALRTIQRMEDVGEVVTLGSLIQEGYRVVYHGTDSINGLKQDQLLPFLSPTQIDKDGAISFEVAEQLPKYYKDEYPKGLAKEGELLVEVKGNVSKVAVVPSVFPKNLMISGSLYKASINQNKADTHYVLAFLKSASGQVLKERLTSNTIINYIAKEALYSIPVFKISMPAQKYIGEKVRQAERLRAWAKSIYEEAEASFANCVLKLGYCEEPKQSYGWSSLQYRLDPAFYDSKFSFLDSEQFKNNSIPLKKFIVEGAYGVLPDSSSYGTGNKRFIRATDLVFSNINPKCFLSVPVDQVKEKAEIKEGDILLEIKGAIKECELAGSHLEGSYVNGSVYRFSVEGIDKGYLCFYLKSFLKQLYCERVSVNNIIAYLDQEGIYSLPILRLTAEIEESFGFAYKQYVDAQRVIFRLTAIAKLLVENLIEGAVSEAELIAAQQALEAGDDSLDRALIERMTAEGIDGEGDPLFDDIDQLYDLLEQAKQALDADDTMAEA